MKTTIMIVLLLISNLIFSQSSSQSLIASSGDFFENSSVSLSWSLGESMSETYINGNCNLTQGFQQSLLAPTTSIDDIVENSRISIYPNPTTDGININFTKLNKNTIVKLFDITGRELFQKELINPNEQLDLSKFSNLIMILNIIENGKLIKSIRIIKK